MGMFDYLHCEVNLPKTQKYLTKDIVFQSKDTPSQCLDNYKIDEEGQLWFEDFNIISESDKESNDFAVFLTKINQHYVKIDHFNGEIEFHHYDDLNYFSITVSFINGKLTELTEVIEFY